MFGLKLHRNGKHKSVDHGYPTAPTPFVSTDKSAVTTKKTIKPSRTTVPSDQPKQANLRASLFDDDEVKGTTSSSSSSYAAGNRYGNNFSEDGGFESRSVQELETYAVYKAEETTSSVNNCLQIAENIREDATKTLVMLHHQGEQITRTHGAAAYMDQDLHRGEKLLGSLGGLFSRTWKPKKNHKIKGPVIMRDDDPVERKVKHMEQREKLGLAPAARKDDTNTRTPLRPPPPEPTNALQKVEVEKYKQDEALSELSSVVGELKGMAQDMGYAIERQNKALEPVQDDIDEMIFRLEQDNARGRYLLSR